MFYVEVEEPETCASANFATSALIKLEYILAYFKPKSKHFKGILPENMKNYESQIKITVETISNCTKFVPKPIAIIAPKIGAIFLKEKRLHFK